MMLYASLWYFLNVPLSSYFGMAKFIEAVNWILKCTFHFVVLGRFRCKIWTGSLWPRTDFNSFGQLRLDITGNSFHGSWAACDPQTLLSSLQTFISPRASELGNFFPFMLKHWKKHLTVWKQDYKGNRKIYSQSACTAFSWLTCARWVNCKVTDSLLMRLSEICQPTPFLLQRGPVLPKFFSWHKHCSSLYPWLCLLGPFIQ